MAGPSPAMTKLLASHQSGFGALGMGDDQQDRQASVVPESGARRLQNLALAAWMMLMLFGGGMLYPTVIIPALTPAVGVLNAEARPVGLDFILFYGTGSLAREGFPAAAYDSRALSSAESRAAGTEIKGLRWPYPPGMLLVARAVASLPYLPAYFCWAALGVMALSLMVWRVTGSVLQIIPLLLCPAASYAAMLGQPSLFAAALAGAGFLLLERRPGLAGALLGVITLKIHLALLLPVCLLASREYRALAAFIAMAALIEVLGLAYAGPAAVDAFIGNATHALGYVAATAELLARNPTVFAALTYAGLLRFALGAQLLTSLIVVAVVWGVWQRTKALAPRSLAWAAGVPLAVPYLFDYDLAIFVVPLAAFAALSARQSTGWLQAAAMSLLWAMPPMIKPMAESAGLQFWPVIEAGLLAYAVWLSRQTESLPAAESAPA